MAQPQPNYPNPGYGPGAPPPAPPKKKRHIIRWLLLAIIAIIVVVVAVSCANSGGGTVSGSAGSSASPAAGSSGSASASPSASSSPAFGQTYTWKDGNAITITPPQPYKPTSSVVSQLAPDAKSFVVVTVTAKNGTSQPINPALVNLQATNAGQQAPEIFDVPTISPPTADIQPGQSLSWKAAFGVQTPTDVQVQASMGFSDSAVVFK